MWQTNIKPMYNGVINVGLAEVMVWRTYLSLKVLIYALSAACCVVAKLCECHDKDSRSVVVCFIGVSGGALLR